MDINAFIQLLDIFFQFWPLESFKTFKAIKTFFSIFAGSNFIKKNMRQLFMYQFPLLYRTAFSANPYPIQRNGNWARKLNSKNSNQVSPWYFKAIKTKNNVADTLFTVWNIPNLLANQMYIYYDLKLKTICSGSVHITFDIPKLWCFCVDVIYLEGDLQDADWLKVPNHLCLLGFLTMPGFIFSPLPSKRARVARDCCFNSTCFLIEWGSCKNERKLIYSGLGFHKLSSKCICKNMYRTTCYAYKLRIPLQP